jgi:hypothetical protein
MSNVSCNLCGHVWDAANMALCPRCQASAWGSVSTLVRDKHNPASGSVWSTVRTVISGEFMGGSVVFLECAAQGGTIFHSLKHGGKYCLFGPPPPGMVAGSVVPRYSPTPTYPEPYLIVADLLGSPHVYAEGTARVKQLIDTGQRNVSSSLRQLRSEFKEDRLARISHA